MRARSEATKLGVMATINANALNFLDIFPKVVANWDAIVIMRVPCLG